MNTETVMQRINGHWAGHELQKEFQQEVADLLQRTQRGFPGAQPVSFSARHIAQLKKEDYYVCEKTDGLRYLMYLTQDGPKDIHYLIDRKNDYYYVPNLHFPHHEDPTFEKFHTGTVLDGELVEDRYPNGDSVIKFLVFDCLVIDNNILMQRPLDKRLAYFKSHVLAPYQAFHKKYPDVFRPFIVADKSTEFSYALPKMFHEIIPSVKKLHGNDGLIFTCKNTPYRPGTDDHILKWKPPEENTIDFLLHIAWPKMEPDPDDPDQSPQEDFLAFPQEFGLYVNYGEDGRYEKHGTLFVTHEEWEKMKALNTPLQDSIVECFLEPMDTNGTANGDDETSTRWRFHRFRDDKLEANHISTYNSVIESIQDHVTSDDLLQHADEMRSAWKGRDAKAREQKPPGR